MNEEDNMAEEMSREFDFVREEVKVLNEQQEKLCKYIEDNFEVQGWKEEIQKYSMLRVNKEIYEREREMMRSKQQMKYIKLGK